METIIQYNAGVQPNVSYSVQDGTNQRGWQGPHNETLQTFGGEEDNFNFVLNTLVVPMVFGAISLTGILGNMLVIHVIRSRRKMRTVTNLLLLNLAVADLSFVVICPPFTAYQMATSQWPFPGLVGDVICKLMHYLLNVTVYVTIYTLVVISIIRWLTIVHNAATMALRTMTNTIMIIVGIWIVMLSVNVPILFSHGVQEIPMPDNKTVNPICDNYGYEPGRKIYGTFFAFAYLLPLSVIAGFSFSILHHIKSQQPTTLSKKNSKSSQRKKQAARLIILVIVIFAIFWLPVHIHLLVAYFTEDLPNSKFYRCLAVLWYFLAYLNSCINPFIYNYASKDFRDSFTETVLCKKPSPEWDREASVITRVVNRKKNGEKEAVVEINGIENNNGDINGGHDEPCIENV